MLRGNTSRSGYAERKTNEQRQQQQQQRNTRLLWYYYVGTYNYLTCLSHDRWNFTFLFSSVTLLLPQTRQTEYYIVQQYHLIYSSNNDTQGICTLECVIPMTAAYALFSRVLKETELDVGTCYGAYTSTIYCIIMNIN
jgi:hypothetical protein